jgi:preprotein translocase subunit SecB
MKFSTLQLVRYITPQFTFRAVDSFDPSKELDIDMETFKVFSIIEPFDTMPGAAERPAWSMCIRINQDVKPGQNLPYEFHLEIVGYFGFANGLPKDLDMETFLKVNGTSALYGAARDFVHSMTARGPWDAFTLPMVSFADLAEKAAASATT